MSTLLEYKCPKCGGAIEFDSASAADEMPLLRFVIRRGNNEIL